MADIRIRLAESHVDFAAAVSLQRAVWGLVDLEITSTIQLIATTHAGGLLQIAETAEGSPVGFAYAFPALEGTRAHLHSDMLAVLPEYQKRGVGVALKWAQRQEALARGIDLVTWTYDPMQARNGNLNLRRLGGTAPRFYEGFYGVTSSALHHGLPTDRLLVRWELRSPRVEERSTQGEPPRSVSLPDLPRVNEVKWQAGWPVSSAPLLGLDAPRLLLEIPPEWDTLSQSAPRLAQDWHAKTRAALGGYLAGGYAVTDFAPTDEGGRRRPFYILSRG
jgi:predicted GNAT superfamily acetyltransferase